ncbi:hypothetical protein JVU11DRAFT_9115 [Chiua virens]|nr:hypothetical protein JVU11DRAFT_9115 [Chiua virens]
MTQLIHDDHAARPDRASCSTPRNPQLLSSASPRRYHPLGERSNHETLLEYHVDIAFDLFETWALQNIFAIPADLPDPSVGEGNRAHVRDGRAAQKDRCRMCSMVV